MILRNGTVLCGGKNGKSFIYDIKNKTLTRKFNSMHNDIVKDLLRIDKYTFASCSKEITIWKY